jgi:AmmeMemoRadiSam system protein B
VTDKLPGIRRDLEFFPVQYRGQQFVLIRDHIGLVQEGRAIPLSLYQVMTLIDGSSTLIDLQANLTRHGGGVLVGSDEVRHLLGHLDDSFLLDSDRYRKAREEIVASFTSRDVRPCSHSGRAYPKDPAELKRRLDEILASQIQPSRPEGYIQALISPHIDLSAGYRTYSCAYQTLKGASPSRIVVLGIGHQMMRDLFCLTEKDFETPLGVVKCEKPMVRKLQAAGGSVVAPDDFPHRSEHSIEFQLIFLQHLLPKDSFTLVPILCGSIQSCLPEYRREAYLSKTGPFLDALRDMVEERDKKTLILAGVDFSHIGPKFGHEMPASYVQPQAEAHDRKLLEALCQKDAALLWEESIRVRDQYNVCGFSALACLMETLPECNGQLLNYEIWHEEATRSAVSFAAVSFTKQQAVSRRQDAEDGGNRE